MGIAQPFCHLPRLTPIQPSHDLVVVRLGHYKGAAKGGADFRKALAFLMEAVPAKN